jgi:hypothetical protein
MESLMYPRLVLPTVAILSLLLGIASGWMAPRFSHNPSSDFPEEPPEAGQSVLVIRTGRSGFPAAVSLRGTSGRPTVDLLVSESRRLPRLRARGTPSRSNTAASRLALTLVFGSPGSLFVGRNE